MKKNRATLIILALAVCVLFAGCDMIFGFIFSLPGDWSVDYTWSGFSPGNMTISFYRNGTFDTDEGQYGVWTQNGLNVVFTYTGPSGANAVYTGSIDFGGMSMSGTMVDPDTLKPGTWEGAKLSSRAIGKGVKAPGVTGGSPK